MIMRGIFRRKKFPREMISLQNDVIFLFLEDRFFFWGLPGPDTSESEKIGNFESLIASLRTSKRAQ